MLRRTFARGLTALAAGSPAAALAAATSPPLRGFFTPAPVRTPAGAPASPTPAAAPLPSDTPHPDPAIDRFFASAKVAWRARVDPPFVRYQITESYYWHDRKQSHAWNATLRTSDRRLALDRIPDASKASGDAFTVEDPPIVANDSFGLVDLKRSANGTIVQMTRPPRTTGRLTEIARTEAFVRDYLMENNGIETLHEDMVQHLLLVPRKEPLKYRLRDLWVSVGDGHTAQLSVQGLFAGAPYDEARWLVQYRLVNGLPYVSRVFNVEDLNFNGQIVRFLSFDCSNYAFPADVPDSVFTT